MSKQKSITNLPAIAAEGAPLPDPGDLMAVVTHYQGSLLRYVGGMLGSADNEAEDIVQEAFVRLHLQVKGKGSQSVRNLTSWLFRTAQNLTIDLIRLRTRRVKTVNTSTDPALLEREQVTEDLDALGEALRQEAREAAIRELGKLDEQYRQVVLLKIIQGMTLRQVAEVVGVSTSMVNYRLNKGLAELAQRLKKAGVV